MKTINTIIAVITVGISANVLAGPDGNRVTASNKAENRNTEEVKHLTQTTGFAKYQPYRNKAAAVQVHTEISAFEKSDERTRVKRRDRVN